MKVFIKTYGCQMNVSDSEMVKGILVSAGYEVSEDMENSDVVVLNTCAVRDTAEEKVIGKLGELKVLKEKNPELIICIAGCSAVNRHEFLKSKMPYLDLIIGTGNFTKLPDLIEGIKYLRSSGTTPSSICRPLIDCTGVRKEHLMSTMHESSVTAYISIMRGCDNFCSFCIVPYVRGREVSLSPDILMRKVNDLAEKGYTQIVLLGQNVTSYGKRFFSDVDDLRDDYARLEARLKILEKGWDE